MAQEEPREAGEGPVGAVPPDEPHLPDIEPVPPRQHDEPVADARAVALFFLVFLLILALMYQLTQGRG
jgi:hypothetical protein